MRKVGGVGEAVGRVDHGEGFRGARVVGRAGGAGGVGVSVGMKRRGMEGGRMGVEGVRVCRGGGGAARL